VEGPSQHQGVTAAGGDAHREHGRDAVSVKQRRHARPFARRLDRRPAEVVDQHIGRLYTQIEGTAPCLSELVQDLWADIDLLLERRLFLELDLQVSNVA
jgi:hypothetical protein